MDVKRGEMAPDDQLDLQGPNTLLSLSLKAGELLYDGKSVPLTDGGNNGCRIACTNEGMASRWAAHAIMDTAPVG